MATLSEEFFWHMYNLHDSEDFQIFSITGHLCDEAVTDSELGVSCVLGLTLTITSVPSQAFPTVFICGSEELLHDYRKQIS